MKISIIVPVYNVESYLRRCVFSLINQSYKNLEIILIDDGSTDSSGELCDELACTDVRIRVVHKKNNGLGAARNTGIELSTGDYIGFVDSDDWIREEMYEHLIKNALKYDADISSMKYQLLKEEQEMIKNYNFNLTVYESNKIMCYMSHMFEKNNLEQMVWNKLYRKELFVDVRFPEKQLYEDMYTTFLLLEKCNRWVMSDEIGYYYFQKSTSITRSAFSTKNLDLIKVCKQITDHVSKYENNTLNEYALALKEKSCLSLLIRIANSDESVDIKIIKKLVNSLKNDLKIVKKSKLSKIEKILIYIVCYNFTIFKFIVKRTYDNYKNR